MYFRVKGNTPFQVRLVSALTLNAWINRYLLFVVGLGGDNVLESKAILLFRSSWFQPDANDL